MSTLLVVLLAAFGLEATQDSVTELELAPVRVTVSLLPGGEVAAGELVTVEARVAGPPAGQPGSDVELAAVDLALPDGSLLAMVPTAADPQLYTAHFFAEGRLGPGHYELAVIVIDGDGREQVATLEIEVLPAGRDVALAH